VRAKGRKLRGGRERQAIPSSASLSDTEREKEVGRPRDCPPSASPSLLQKESAAVSPFQGGRQRRGEGLVTVTDLCGPWLRPVCVPFLRPLAR